MTYFPHCGCPHCSQIRFDRYGSRDKLSQYASNAGVLPGAPLPRSADAVRASAQDLELSNLIAKYDASSPTIGADIDRRWSDPGYVGVRGIQW
jgi:hypothetical protein